MIHIKKIKPQFTSILTTGNKFLKDEKENGIIVAKKGDLKAWQTVITTGPSVRDIKEGDKVMINFANYMVKKYSKDSIQNDIDNNPTIKYDLPWVTIEDEKGNPQNCLLINDRDVLYSFEGEEVEQEDSKILKVERPELVIPK